MNSRHLIAAALAALSTTAALADDPTIDNTRHTSTVSRAEVKAEVRQALKDHTLPVDGEFGAQWTPAPTSTLSRAAVKEDVRQALKSGTLVVAGEYGEQWPAPIASTLTRSAVKAEVLAARSRGELQPAGELDVATLHASHGSYSRTPSFFTALAHLR